MTRNPILQEIYAARQEILAEYGGDLAAYIRSANQRVRESGHPIAQIKQRTLRCTGAAKPGESAAESQPSPPFDR